ncbi:hypothetical protein FGG08_004078 [Glutinoglossum americanum]|uniref:Uncharacterized protein n=1 Tax=Glutinoglossum americanum TaxID=1670608 RepID=A0A9P8I183_9PEZI|nr:hypothetical protein FGG08_004078 [Glutinoglossum americanum]
MDSFTTLEKDIERDEEALARKHKQEAEENKGEEPGKAPTPIGLETESNTGTVRLCIAGLGKGPVKPIRRIIRFAVGEGDDKVPVISHIANQSARSIAATTDDISYDSSTGYAVNMDKTLISFSFFNRTLMSCRLERKEITIRHTFDDVRVECVEYHIEYLYFSGQSSRSRSSLRLRLQVSFTKK